MCQSALRPRLQGDADVLSLNIAASAVHRSHLAKKWIRLSKSMGWEARWRSYWAQRSWVNVIIVFFHAACCVCHGMPIQGCNCLLKSRLRKLLCRCTWHADLIRYTINNSFAASSCPHLYPLHNPTCFSGKEGMALRQITSITQIWYNDQSLVIFRGDYPNKPMS